VAALGLNRVHQTQMLFLESREPTEGGHGGPPYSTSNSTSHKVY